MLTIRTFCIIATITFMSATAWAQDNSASSTLGLQMELSRTINQLMAATGSNNADDSQTAIDALQKINRIYYQALMSNMDSGDIEVQARIRETLAGCMTEAKTASLLALVSPDVRNSVARLRPAYRQILNGILSQDILVMQDAVRKAADIKDDPKAADALLIIALQSGKSDIVGTLANEIISRNMKSDELAVALANAAVKVSMRNIGATRNNSDYYVFSNLMACLHQMKNPKVAPILAALMIQSGKSLYRRSYDANQYDIAVCETLINTGNKAVIPLLMDDLTISGTESIMYDTGVAKVTVKQSDYRMNAIIRISDQNTSDYKMVSTVYNTASTFGFRNDTNRQESLKLLIAWWEKAQNQPEYKKLPTLVLPDLKELSENPLYYWSGATTAPAASQPAIARQRIEVPQVDALCTNLSAAIKDLVASLGDKRLTRRQNAQASIAALYSTYLSTVNNHVTDSDSKVVQAAMLLLGSAYSEGVFQQAIGMMDKDSREKMLQFRQANPRLVDDLFSDNSLACRNAFRKLRQLSDPDGLAEPMLEYLLRSQQPQLKSGALLVLSRGRYRSDAIVDSLSKIFLTTNSQYGVNWYRMSQESGNNYETLEQITQADWPPLALKALSAINSPKATESYLKHFNNTNNYYDLVGSTFIIDAIVKLDDKRAIPALLDIMQRTNTANSGRSAIGIGNKQYSCGVSDIILYGLIKLTDQDQKTYKLVNVRQNYFRYGFEKDQDRNTATKQMLEWWKNNKDREPYKNIEFLETTSGK